MDETTAAVAATDDIHVRGPTSAAILAAMAPRIEPPRQPSSYPVEGLRTRPLPSMHARLALLLVVLQLVWALGVPLKNVMFIPWPTIVEDSTSVLSMEDYPGGLDRANGDVVLTGVEVADVLRAVIATALDSSTIMSHLMYTQSFSVDQLTTGITNNQYEAFSRYAMLVHQVSEFVGGTFTVHNELVNVPGAAGNIRRSVQYSCVAEDVNMTGVVCTNQHGEPCKWDAGERQSMAPVSLVSLRSQTSLENHFALLMLVEQFHRIIMSFFRTQDWSATVTEFASSGIYNTSAPDALTFNKDDASFGHDAALVRRNVSVMSCVATELFLGRVYAVEYALDLIQTEFSRRSAFQNNTFHRPSQLARTRIEGMLERTKMRISSGVWCSPRTEVAGKLFNHELTSIRTSTCYKKLSRTLTDSPVLGSPTRFLQGLMSDPSANSYRNVQVLDDTTIHVQHAVLGAYASNMDTFKPDRTLMSNRMWKLRERTKTESDGNAVHPLLQARRFESWLAPYMVRNATFRNNLITLVDNHLEQYGDSQVPDNVPVPSPCSSGMIITLMQVAWVGLVARNPLLLHLAWNTMVGGGRPAEFLLNQIAVRQLVTENSLGQRNPLNVPDVVTRAVIWPMLPILEQHRRLMGSGALADLILHQFNDSLSQVLLKERDKIFFGTSSRCAINVKRNNISSGEPLATMYAKQYSTYAAVVRDLLEVLPALVADMDASVARIRIPSQYLTGTATYPLGIASLEGPPVPFQRSAITYGLVRLTCLAVPTADLMEKLRDTEQCYDSLDLRYLNATVRCFREDGIRTEHVIMKSGEKLRVFLYGNWSVAVTINLLAFWIILIHMHQILGVYRLSRLNDLTIWHACHVNLQGPNMLPPSNLVIMSASTLSLLISSRLPIDEEFVVQVNEQASWVCETLLLLCLSWFLRLGVELGRWGLTLRSPNKISNVMFSALRNVLLLVVFVFRMGIPDDTYDQAVSKVSVSCAICIVIGWTGVAVATAWPQHSHYSKKTKPDWISTALAQCNASRARFGVFACSPYDGWSLSALMLEGWSLRSVKDKPMLIFEDKFIIPLQGDHASPAANVQPHTAHSAGSVRQLQQHPLIDPASSIALRRQSKSSSKASSKSLRPQISHNSN